MLRFHCILCLEGIFFDRRYFEANLRKKRLDLKSTLGAKIKIEYRCCLK